MITLFSSEESNVVGDDTWELFQAVEDSFGVELGDYNCLAGISVEDLAKKVAELANYPAEEDCLSAAAFYRLRQVLQNACAAPRRVIRPTTSVSQLLPWRSRTRQWKLIEQQLGLALPKLAYPTWLALTALLIPLSILIAARVLIGAHLTALEIIGGSLGLALPTILLLSPFARALPPDRDTVGGLSKAILARNYAFFASKHGSSHERGIIAAIRYLAACQSGRRVEEVSSKTRIPTDLNIY